MKSIAAFTVRGMNKMPPASRKRLARWLRSMASWLVKNGPECAPTFRGRYYGRGP